MYLYQSSLHKATATALLIHTPMSRRGSIIAVSAQLQDPAEHTLSIMLPLCYILDISTSKFCFTQPYVLQRLLAHSCTACSARPSIMWTLHSSLLSRLLLQLSSTCSKGRLRIFHNSFGLVSSPGLESHAHHEHRYKIMTTITPRSSSCAMDTVHHVHHWQSLQCGCAGEDGAGLGHETGRRRGHAAPPLQSQPPAQVHH